ncbi:MAG TPA: alkaline phosphatase family protein [Thermoanaerobaculia bacterium]
MQTHPRSILSVLGLALAAGLLIASSASASVDVTVSKPADGATVPLTFNVQASATTTNAGAVVTGWHIYVDGADKYGTAGPTSSINTNVATTAGTHTVIVRAWDSTGEFGDQTLTITASSAAVLVNVSTPANNATVPLTFNVQASATTSNSGATVTGWHIYIDSVDKYGTSGPTSSINTNVTTTEGTHTVLVRAWDSTGAFGDKTLTVNATPGVLMNVSTPTNGSNVQLTFNVTASASTSNSGATVTGWHIYIDSADVYGTSGPTSSINVSVTTTRGTHTLLVRAWDSTGAFGDQTLTINAGDTGVGALAGHNHVVVVAFENHSYETVVGSSSAPYFNSLIASYGLATNNYANGHDSLSQYWWMMDGTNNCGGSVCNSDPTNTVATADSIIREVINSGKSWKQYTEALPFRGDLVETTSSGITTSQGTYYARHSPAIFLSDVRQGVAGNSNNPSTYCSGEPNGYDSTKQACNVVNFADANNGFIADINAGRLPNFSLVIPNGCDDAHDCSFSTTDSWMQTNIGALLNSSWFQPGGDGLLILWFDEGSLSGFTAACGTTAHADNRSSSTSCSGGGGRTAVVVVAPDLKAANYKSPVYYQHPSVTHSVCNALGINTPAPASTATDFTDFFQ